MMAAIAEILIENERSDTRFEEFAREICERNESITLLPTSKSWDRGRDARSTSPSRYTHQGILCASLNKDIDSKAEADLLRVTSTSSTERLIYCSSQKLSEEKADDLTKIIRRHIPSGSVLVLGAQQLGALADKWPECCAKRLCAARSLNFFWTGAAYPRRRFPGPWLGISACRDPFLLSGF